MFWTDRSRTYLTPSKKLTGDHQSVDSKRSKLRGAESSSSLQAVKDDAKIGSVNSSMSDVSRGSNLYKITTGEYNLFVMENPHTYTIHPSIQRRQMFG
jgi:hypothetical protein